MFILCLSLVLAGCAGLGAGQEPPPRPKYQDIDIGALIETYDGYLYAVHYPITHYPQVDEEILAYVRGRVEAFHRTAQDAPPAPVERWPLELFVEFTLAYQGEEWFSILLTESVYSGATKVREDLATWNIDRRQGRIVPLSQLFMPERDYLGRLSASASGRLLRERPREMAPAQYEAWVAAITQPAAEAFNQYLVTGEGLVFYFQSYRLESTEHPQVLIPWAEVADLLVDGALPSSLAPAVPGATGPASGSGNEPGTGGTPGGGAPDFSGEPSPRTKRAALTFDDGPSDNVTPVILDILQRKGVPATFFVLGNRVDFYPELLQRMVAEGHEIGNHSWNHARLTRLSPEEIVAQIEWTQEAVYAWTGQRPLVVRPPYGAVNSRVSQAIPMPLVLWSVDTRDWETRNRDQIVAEALAGVHDGAIILFHDLFPSTAEALEEIIDALHRQGYELVTVSRLLGFEDQETWARHAGQPVRQWEPD